MVKDLDKIALLGIFSLVVFNLFSTNNKKGIYSDFTPKPEYEKIKDIEFNRIKTISSSIEKLESVKEQYQTQIINYERDLANTEINFIKNQQQEARILISQIQSEIIKYNPFHKKRLRSGDLQFKLKQQVRDRRDELMQQNEQRIAAQSYIDKSDSQIIAIQRKLEEIEKESIF